MPEETNNMPSQDAADSERSGDRRLSTCSRLTAAQLKLLRLCAAHVSERMWLPAKLKRDRQVAVQLAEKGMIAATGSLEGSYVITGEGRKFLTANA